ncbi:MAG: hypothetical protein AB7S55_08105, partial [Thiomonas sp.]
SKSAPVTCHGGETPKAASNSLSVIPDPVPAQVQLTHSKLKRGQLSFGLNYYGTIGANRDAFCIVRKMAKVDWMDEPAGPAYSHERPHHIVPQA